MGKQVYSDWKIFHFPEKIASLPLEAASTGPLHLRIKPTNICNHACWYCCYRKLGMPMGKDMNTRDVLPWDKLQEVIEDFHEMGGKAVTFSGGGEPFCYPRLLDAARLLHALDIKFATLTNGELLHGECADFFAKYASWVRISMDGWDDESYRAYRRVGHGVYTRIIKNIQNFVEQSRECMLSVAYNIDCKNYGHIPEMLAKLKQIGVRSVQLTACIFSSNEQEERTKLQTFLAETTRLIRHAKQELESDAFEINDNVSQVQQEYIHDFDWCPYLQVLSVIGADQKVYACQHKAYNFNCGLLGDLRNQRFKEFWLSSKEKFFKINPRRDCRHFCRAHKKNIMLHQYLNINKAHIEFV